MNDELFRMLDENKEKYNKTRTYIIEKAESKKMKRCFNFNFDKKKMVKLTVGGLIIFSGVFLRNVSDIKPVYEGNDIKNNPSVVSSGGGIFSGDISSIEKEIKMNKMEIQKYNEERYKTEVNKLSSVEISEEVIYEVGNHKDISYVENYIMTEEYKIFEKYGNAFGIDPKILVAIAMQESSLRHNNTLPGSSNYNSYSTGMFQISVCYYDKEITAFNYEKNDYETIFCTKKSLEDLETNVKTACMLLQGRLKMYNGNIFLAIQSYNYGETMLNSILSFTAQELNCDNSDITNDYQNISWHKHVKEAHNNPGRYMNGYNAPYGDGEYIFHVLNYCVNDTITYKYNGEDKILDLKSGTILDGKKKY